MVTKGEARKYLSDAPPEQCFWVNNGPILRNLEELTNVLPEMSDDTLQHHINNEKNDFCSWVSYVIGDKKLANELMGSKSKDSMLKKLRRRLDSLKKKAD